jgi:peptidoglycan hydrolase-like protein with peptidoglycan-binding domain
MKESPSLASKSQSEQAASGTETPVSRSAVSGDPSAAGQVDVRQAQETLKNQGQDPGPIDGIMGPRTRQALREFQGANGLEQTGTLDAATRQKLAFAR